MFSLESRPTKVFRDIYNPNITICFNSVSIIYCGEHTNMGFMTLIMQSFVEQAKNGTPIPILK